MELFYLGKYREYVIQDFGHNDVPLWKDALGSLLGQKCRLQALEWD